MVRRVNSSYLEKKMEKEREKIFESAKEEPIRVTKYIIIIFSFFGIWNAYNDGIFFQNLFPYTLLGLYDNFIYTRYSIGNSILKFFIKGSKFFYRATFFVAALGYFNFIGIENKNIFIWFEGEKYELIRSYYIFIWVFIYYLLMGAEIFLPLDRGEKKC